RCDECQLCYHFGCLDPPLKKSPKQTGYGWICQECDTSSSKGYYKSKALKKSCRSVTRCYRMRAVQFRTKAMEGRRVETEKRALDSGRLWGSTLKGSDALVSPQSNEEVAVQKCGTEESICYPFPALTSRCERRADRDSREVHTSWIHLLFQPLN
ncbi:hypothetical protein PO909_004917, partial [Leuciscus waleckii]